MSIGDQRSAQRLIHEVLDTLNPPSPPLFIHITLHHPSPTYPASYFAPRSASASASSRDRPTHARSVSNPTTPTFASRTGFRTGSGVQVQGEGAEMSGERASARGLAHRRMRTADGLWEGAGVFDLPGSGARWSATGRGERNEGGRGGENGIGLPGDDGSGDALWVGTSGRRSQHGGAAARPAAHTPEGIPSSARALAQDDGDLSLPRRDGAPTLHIVRPSTSTTRSRADDAQITGPDARITPGHLLAPAAAQHASGSASPRAAAPRPASLLESVRTGEPANFAAVVQMMTDGHSVRSAAPSADRSAEKESSGPGAKESSAEMALAEKQATGGRAQTRRRHFVGPGGLMKRIASKASVGRLRIKPPSPTEKIESSPQTGDPLLSHGYGATPLTRPSEEKRAANIGDSTKTSTAAKRTTLLRPAPPPPDRPTTPTRYAPSHTAQTHQDDSLASRRHSKRSGSPHSFFISPSLPEDGSQTFAPVDDASAAPRAPGTPSAPTRAASMRIPVPQTLGGGVSGSSDWLKTPHTPNGGGQAGASPGRTLSVREDGMVEIPRFKKRELNLGMVPCGPGRRGIWLGMWVWTVIWAMGSLFLDANVLYMLLQCALRPPLANEAGSRSWTFATAAYGVCLFISVALVWLGWGVWYEYWRRWRLPRPAMEPMHTSLPASLHLALTSFPHFCFLLHVRLSPLRTPSASDIFPETAHLAIQTLPAVIPVLPRASIAIVLFVSFTSASSIPARNGKDPNFWRASGALSTYARGVIYALLGITALRIFVVLVAAGIIWAFSRRRLPAGRSGPRRRRSALGESGNTTPVGMGTMTTIGAHAGSSSREISAPSTPPRRRDPAMTSSPSKGWVAEADLPWAWRDRGRNRLQDAFELCMMRPTRRAQGHSSALRGLAGYSMRAVTGASDGSVVNLAPARENGMGGTELGRGSAGDQQDPSPTSVDPFMRVPHSPVAVRFVEPGGEGASGMARRAEEENTMVSEHPAEVSDQPAARPESILDPHPPIPSPEKLVVPPLGADASLLTPPRPRLPSVASTVAAHGRSPAGAGGLGALPAARQSTSSQDLFYTPLSRTPATERTRSEVDLGLTPLPSAGSGVPHTSALGSATSSGTVTPTPPSAYRRPSAPAPSSSNTSEDGAEVLRSALSRDAERDGDADPEVATIRASSESSDSEFESDDATALLRGDGAKDGSYTGRRGSAGEGAAARRRASASTIAGAVEGSVRSVRSVLSSPSLRTLRQRAGSIVSLRGGDTTLGSSSRVPGHGHGHARQASFAGLVEQGGPTRSIADGAGREDGAAGATARRMRSGSLGMLREAVVGRAGRGMGMKVDGAENRDGQRGESGEREITRGRDGAGVEAENIDEFGVLR